MCAAVSSSDAFFAREDFFRGFFADFFARARTFAGLRFFRSLLHRLSYWSARDSATGAFSGHRAEHATYNSSNGTDNTAENRPVAAPAASFEIDGS